MQFNACGCHWCEKLQWPLLYNLDGEQYWFEIPRSCSVTVKETFPDRKQIFRNDPEYKDAEEPIVIYTDPLVRFISCINAYITPHQRYYAYGQDIYQSFGRDLNVLSKQQKIDLFFENIDKITSKHQVHHFHPQTKFIDMEAFNAFEVLEREDVSYFFGVYKIHNETRKDITIHDLSNEQVTLIKNFYQSDYDFFKKYG